MAMPWEEDLLDFSELESRMADFVDRSTIEDNIRIQLGEFEMIQSIFPNAKEVVLDDPAVIFDLQNYIDGKTMHIPPQLDFHINLTIEDQKFEINVNLPFDYPTQEPDIFVRSDSLGRAEQHCLNEDLSRFISSLERDEVCIYSGITWLQENAMSYFGKKVEVSPSKRPRTLKMDGWTRMWIYSHHIYSKSKRKELQDLAQEYNITGFCLPGRPGVICFEGYQVDCEDCWARVRSMNWKKIICVKEERGGTEEIDSFRRFNQFREIAFDGSKTRGGDFHVDFGEFYKFLCEHNCDYAFKTLFGVDGKIAS